jgi:integrase
VKLFDRIPTMETFRKDLEAAGLPYETQEGVMDFHALRTTFITSLARRGVPLAAAQRLARHSTPQLTSNVYTRLELQDLHREVAKLERGSVARGSDRPCDRRQARPGA